MTVSNQFDQDQAEVFWKMLRDYNAEQIGAYEIEDVFITLQDEEGNIQGGLNGRTGRGWLFIQNLAVSKELRGQGLGSRLLAAAEEEARKRGCRSVFLDTYSFQARPFYEKHGYSVFATLDDYPIGHQRFFMTKKL